MRLHEKLKAMNACCEAVVWSQQFKSAQSAWDACERGDWMLWYAQKLCSTLGQRRRLVLAACACARVALPFVVRGESRPEKAVELAERWARREKGVTLAMVAHAATDAAICAAAYAATDAAIYAARAAACAAAYAARAAAEAAAYAAYAAAAEAAYAATDAAAYAAYAATHAAAAEAVYAATHAQTTTHAALADIVRQHYPVPPRARR